MTETQQGSHSDKEQIDRDGKGLICALNDVCEHGEDSDSDSYKANLKASLCARSSIQSFAFPWKHHCQLERTGSWTLYNAVVSIDAQECWTWVKEEWLFKTSGCWLWLGSIQILYGCWRSGKQRCRNIIMVAPWSVTIYVLLQSSAHHWPQGIWQLGIGGYRGALPRPLQQPLRQEECIIWVTTPALCPGLARPDLKLFYSSSTGWGTTEHGRLWLLICNFQNVKILGWFKVCNYLYSFYELG